jgi:hypothetical protein
MTDYTALRSRLIQWPYSADFGPHWIGKASMAQDCRDAATAIRNMQDTVAKLESHIAATCRKCNGTGFSGGGGTVSEKGGSLYSIKCDHGMKGAAT